jgi:hypothetical protein
MNLQFKNKNNHVFKKFQNLRLHFHRVDKVILQDQQK